MQSFELGDSVLSFDAEKAILLCRDRAAGKKRWIKKLADVMEVLGIIEDARHYYLATETDGINGYHIAIRKNDGETAWFIPGRAFFQVLYDGTLYAIFSDASGRYYLLNVDPADGRKIWHHPIEQDLTGYHFRRDRILLTFESGRTLALSPVTGAIVR